MVNEERKIGKVIEELTVFFLNAGATDISTEVKKDGRFAHLIFRSDFAPEYEQDVRKFDEYMDEPRNEGIEDMYWELAGSGNAAESSQLLLIAMMSGKRELNIEGNRVEVKLSKALWN